MVSGQHCEDKDRLKRRKAPEGGQRGTLMSKMARQHKLCHSVTFTAKRPHPKDEHLCRRGERLLMLLGITARVFWGWWGGLDKQSLSGGAQSVSSTGGWGAGGSFATVILRAGQQALIPVDNLANVLVDQKSNFVKKKFLATVERRPNLQVFSLTCACSPFF